MEPREASKFNRQGKLNTQLKMNARLEQISSMRGNRHGNDNFSTAIYLFFHEINWIIDRHVLNDLAFHNCHITIATIVTPGFL